MEKNRTELILDINEWLNHPPKNRSTLQVCLVFQVACPGCFEHALPALLACAAKFDPRDVEFVAVATAFEDFELNTLENARALVESGVVVGPTRRLYDKCDLDFSKIPVGFDRVTRGVPDAQEVDAYTTALLRRFGLPEAARQEVRASVSDREWTASTFHGNMLFGTPSWLVYKPQTLELVHSQFGAQEDLEGLVAWCLNNPR